MSNQNVTVRIDAKPAGDLAAPFNALAGAAGKADAAVKRLLQTESAFFKEGFGSGSSSGGLSQASRNQFASSFKYQTEQAKKFAEWTSGVKQGGGSGGAAGPGGRSGGGFIEVNQAAEMFAKVGSVFGEIGKMADLFAGDADAMKGTYSKALADGFEDWVSRVFGENTGSKTAARGLERRQARAEMSRVEKADQVRGLVIQNRAAREGGALAAGAVLNLSQYTREGYGLSREQSDTARMDAARERSRKLGGLGELEMVRAGLGGTMESADSLMAGNMAAREAINSRALLETRKKDTAAAAREKGVDPGVRLGNVEALMKLQEDAQKRVVAAEQKHLDIIRQQSQERLNGLKAARDATQNIIDTEKGKLGGFAEEFGRMTEGQQELTRTLAGKFSRGEKLAPDEMARAREIGILGDAVQKQDRAAGEAAGVQQVIKELGLDKKLEEAEKTKIEIQNKIEAEIKINERGLAEQMAQVLLPEIQKLTKITMDRIKAEMDNQARQRGNQEKAGGK